MAVSTTTTSLLPSPPEDIKFLTVDFLNRRIYQINDSQLELCYSAIAPEPIRTCISNNISTTCRVYVGTIGGRERFARGKNRSAFLRTLHCLKHICFLEKVGRLGLPTELFLSVDPVGEWFVRDGSIRQDAKTLSDDDVTEQQSRDVAEFFYYETLLKIVLLAPVKYQLCLDYLNHTFESVNGRIVIVLPVCDFHQCEVQDYKTRHKELLGMYKKFYPNTLFQYVESAIESAEKRREKWASITPEAEYTPLALTALKLQASGVRDQSPFLDVAVEWVHCLTKGSDITHFLDVEEQLKSLYIKELIRIIQRKRNSIPCLSQQQWYISIENETINDAIKTFDTQLQVGMETDARLATFSSRVFSSAYHLLCSQMEGEFKISIFKEMLFVVSQWPLKKERGLSVSFQRSRLVDGILSLSTKMG